MSADREDVRFVRAGHSDIIMRDCSRQYDASASTAESAAIRQKMEWVGYSDIYHAVDLRY